MRMSTPAAILAASATLGVTSYVLLTKLLQPCWNSEIRTQRTSRSRHSIPTQEVLSQMSDAEVEEYYYTYAENMDVLCVNKVRLGKSNDGGWDVCDDPDYRPQPPCLVYSFGIDFDFTFDDDVSFKYGCEVHSFDPSMNRSDHKRVRQVFFHNLGLSDREYVNSRGWTMKTLTSIKAQLGHSKVDILKMDIEQAEHTALRSIMATGELRGTTQLLLEIHINGENKRRVRSLMETGLQLFRGLHDLGFRVFYSHRNDACTRTSVFTARSRTVCHEVFMVNSNW